MFADVDAVEVGDPPPEVLVEVLTGRNFTTGKSGSGKSNTLSVVAEQLLERGYSLLIVDVEGEYYGLKEEFEVLHAGADDECDVQVEPAHAEKLATLALEENIPIVLDVSGFLDEDDARELIQAVARQLFTKEKKQKQPFLLAVEEIHEYIPERGGLDETGQMLVKIAKRGRKHGLGLAGVSQRPADVKKDVITQCDWLVWHRLTWDNDTNVVKRVLGSDYGDAVEDLADGEGFLQTDWGDDVRRVQAHRKQTFDAGATPGLDDFERPDLEGVSDDLVDQLQSISDQRDRREDELAEKERAIDRLEDEVGDLEEQLAQARDVQDLAEQFTDAMTGAVAGDGGAGEHAVDEIRAEVMEVRQEKRALEDDADAVRAERDRLQERVDELEAELDERTAPAAVDALRADVQELLERNTGVLDVDGSDQADRLRERVRELEAENDQLRAADEPSMTGTTLGTMVQHDAVRTAVATVAESESIRIDHFERVLDVLAVSDGQWMTAAEIAPLTDVSESSIYKIGKQLQLAGTVAAREDGQRKQYCLDEDALAKRIKVAEQQVNGDGRAGDAE